MLLKHLFNKNRQRLTRLPKLSLTVDKIQTLLRPEDFRQALLEHIEQAQERIYITVLYFEHDDAGKEIFEALYAAKKRNPELNIKLFVDFHRAQRGRIGEQEKITNAQWYEMLSQQHQDYPIPVYGVPVNTRETLGVLHLKGCVFDDRVIYSGASINDVYLAKHDKYRYDRYHLLTQAALADCFVNYLDSYFVPNKAVRRLDQPLTNLHPERKKLVKQFRSQLRQLKYQFSADEEYGNFAITPLIGLGKTSPLNRVIHDLFNATEHQLIICTPYFNLPGHLIKSIVGLLRRGRQVEIIVGDKTANDFYIPPEQPFKIIAAVPYLYEINLRNFAKRLQKYIDKEQLKIRIWKDGDNTFHLKGVWVDDNWQLITGNNLNPRAMRLDLENAILFYDAEQQLYEQRLQELEQIRTHTTVLTHYRQLEQIRTYPHKVKKLIHRVKRIRVDRIINRLL